MRAPVYDMCVDLCRTHVLVSEEFLNRPNVVARFQQVGRERVAQGMGTDLLIDAGRLRRQLDGALQSVLVEMVPTGVVRAWIDR